MVAEIVHIFDITKLSIILQLCFVFKQANRFGEESLTLGSEYSSQISVDLKFARSLVRASEIQATLQEQR